MNVLPLSDVAFAGKEKKASHWFRKAFVQESASAVSKGMAWTNLVVLQTIVRR